MLLFNISGSVLDGPSTELRGLMDVKFVLVGGTYKVVVASEADSAITTFSFENGMLGSVVDTQSYSATSGTQMVSDLTLTEIAGETVLLPATRYEDQTELYKVANDGTLGAGVDPTGIDLLGTNVAVTLGANTYVYTFGAGGSGISAYSLDVNWNFTMVDQEADTASTFLGDVSAFASATVGSVEYLIVASALDTGISTYSIGANGTLTLADAVAPDEFSGFWKPQALLTVEVGGTDYVVMASAGTSSLTVYSLGANGALVEADHLIDTLDTRFQDAAVIDSFEFGGRTFIVAAGSDDGITVLELLSNGALRVQASLADTYDITLDNVSAISAETIDGKIEVLVSSATDHGFTHITSDPTQLGSNVTGTEGDDVLQGTVSADVINGEEGNDVINAGGGADLLIDGAGVDLLEGGEGRDVFQFVEDGAPDAITDFESGIDQIDLSQFSGVAGMDDISMQTYCDGVIIFANNDAILVQNGGDVTYDATDFVATDFIF